MAVKRFFRLVIGGTGLLAALTCGAGPVEFSADAVQRSPDSEPVTAHMYVGAAGVRKEYTVNSQALVEIFDYANGRAVLLNKDQKQYMEQKASSGGLKDWNNASTNPCDGLEGASCTKLGQEQLQGRTVEQWQMTMTQDGKPARALYWIDVERKMPLKQIFPDGTVSELHYLGSEAVNGRNTEKWEMVTTRSNGETMRSQQWYDPELNIAIREQLPGGFSRELTNIQVAKQPDSLFQIPADYKLLPNSEAGGAPPAASQGR